MVHGYIRMDAPASLGLIDKNYVSGEADNKIEETFKAVYKTGEAAST